MALLHLEILDSWLPSVVRFFENNINFQKLLLFFYAGERMWRHSTQTFQALENMPIFMVPRSVH